MGISYGDGPWYPSAKQPDIDTTMADERLDDHEPLVEEAHELVIPPKG